MKVIAELTSNLIQVTASLSTGTIRAKGEIINRIAVSTARSQDKDVTPTEEDQHITPDAGFDNLSTVTVRAIPKNYGRIAWNGTTLSVY